MQRLASKQAWSWWRQGRQEVPAPDWKGMLFGALLFLLIAAATLGPDSFFLIFDSPTHHVAGLWFARGEWAYSGNKALIMGLLALLTRLFGPNPLNETIALSVLGAAATMALADMAFIAFQRRRAALLAVLLWISTGSVLFYFRTHVGFPLGFFVIAAALYLRRRFLWSGCFFLLALLSHTSFVVPIIAWLSISLLLGTGPQSPFELFSLAAPLGVGYLAYEYVALRYTTELWHTARNFLSEIQKLDSPTTLRQPVTYLWFMFRVTNGAPVTWLMTLGLAAVPFTWRSASRAYRAIVLAAVSIVGFYFIRTSFLQQVVVFRVLAAALPFLVILCTAILLELPGLMARLHPKLSGWAYLVLVALLPFHMLYVLLGVQGCSHSYGPVIETTFREAAAAGTPVLFWGNQWAGAYYREVTGAEVLIDPERPVPLAFETANAVRVQDLPPSSPVVIVDNIPPEERSAALEAAGIRLSPRPAERVSVPSCGFTLVEGLEASYDRLLERDALREWRHPVSFSTIYVWETRVESP